MAPVSAGDVENTSAGRAAENLFQKIYFRAGLFGRRDG